MERAAAPRRRIPRVSGFLIEHISVRGTPDSRAVLVDQFGQPRRLPSSLILGREPGEPGLVLLESSVSRRHAELRLTDGGWQIRDLDSTNGTFVEGHRVHDAVTLASGQLVVVGDIGFLFYEDGESEVAVRETAEIRATAVSPTRVHASLRLCEPSAGGGGDVDYQGQRIQLSETQFALLILLARRYLADADRPEDVRGFVQSSELLVNLPFTTAYPDENHLKQVVRRVRRGLERLGLADAIESRQRFGYRLLVDPIIER